MVSGSLFRVMKFTAGLALQFAAIAAFLALAIVLVVAYHLITLPTRVVAWARRV